MGTSYSVLLQQQVRISALPPFVAHSIRQFQEDNPTATQGDVITAYDAIDYWLSWEGIIRYTDNMINLFVAVLEEAAPKSKSPQLRVNKESESEPAETAEANSELLPFYVTYSIGGRCKGCYSVVYASNYREARQIADKITKGQFAFMYTAEEFAGQVERHKLQVIELQAQGKVE